MKERHLRSVRLLAECYQAFEAFSALQIRTFGLTPSQFDIIATLGNTPGMSFKELGEKTLITKGTLTGIVDRLEAKGLVKRCVKQEDRRSITVRLTAKGIHEFKRIFGPHVQFCKQPFANYSQQDFETLERELSKLKACLQNTISRFEDEADRSDSHS